MGERVGGGRRPEKGVITITRPHKRGNGKEKGKEEEEECRGRHEVVKIIKSRK